VSISVVLLGVGIENASVGTAYSDPVAKIRARDESLYANMAVRLASTGEFRFLRQRGVLGAVAAWDYCGPDPSNNGGVKRQEISSGSISFAWD